MTMVFQQKEVIADIEGKGDFLFHKGDQLGEGRPGHRHFGKADLEHDGEGERQKQQQPQERDADDGRPSRRQKAFPSLFLLIYHVSTTAALGCQLR